MNKFKSTILTMSIFFYVLCAVTIGFVAVNFFSSILDRTEALPPGSSPINPNPDIFEPGGGGGSSGISWRYWVDYEDLPDDPGYGYSDLRGSGTQSDPYKIYNQETFLACLQKTYRNYNYVYARLEQDFLYYTTDQYDGIYNSWTAVDSADYGRLSIDGNYKRIDLDININTDYYGEPDYPRSYGLIGGMNYLTVKNLKVTGRIRVIGSYIESVGGLIGRCLSTSLDNCYIAPNIDVAPSSSAERSTCVGGIVGATTYLNSNSGAGQLYMTNSVFCGKIEVNSNVNKRGHLSTTGTSSDSVQEYLTNSYYKYHYKTGVSTEEMRSSSITTQNFDKAYTDYKANNSTNAFVEGVWENVGNWNYYYCAAPTVAWILNRNINNSPTEFKYVVNKNGGSSGSANHVAWAINPGSSSATASTVKFTDVGKEYTKNVSYTIDTGYEARMCTQNTSGKVCTLTITLDFKVEVQIMSAYIKGTSTALSTSLYDKTETGSIERNYPDLISFSYDASLSNLTLTYGKNEKTTTTTFKTTDSPYLWDNWKIKTTTGTNLGTSGNIGSYRSSCELSGNKYILKIYPMAKLKTYNITIK